MSVPTYTQIALITLDTKKCCSSLTTLEHRVREKQCWRQVTTVHACVSTGRVLIGSCPWTFSSQSTSTTVNAQTIHSASVLVSDIAIFALKRDVKLQLTNSASVQGSLLWQTPHHLVCKTGRIYVHSTAMQPKNEYLTDENAQVQTTLLGLSVSASKTLSQILTPISCLSCWM